LRRAIVRDDTGRVDFVEGRNDRAIVTERRGWRPAKPLVVLIQSHVQTIGRPTTGCVVGGRALGIIDPPRRRGLAVKKFVQDFVDNVAIGVNYGLELVICVREGACRIRSHNTSVDECAN